MINNATYSPCGRYIATANENGSIKIFEIETGALLRVIEGNPDALVSISYSPDGKNILTASKCGTLSIWEAETGKIIYTVADE